MTTCSMVPRLQLPQAGTSARENPLGTRGGYYNSAEKLQRGELLVTGCRDVEENNMHSDWQEWMASVQVRNRTKAFYRPRRRRNGKKEDWRGTVADETAHGRSYFLWRERVCTGLVMRSVDEHFYYKKMFSMYYQCRMEQNLEDVDERRRFAPSSNVGARQRSIDEVPAPSYADQLSKSAVSRQSVSLVGSADWYAALKERLRIAERFCIPKQRQLDRTGVVRDVEGVVMPSLTPAMQHEVEAALVPTPPDEVLASAFRLNISRADMHTLSDSQWLNDEVVNFYMNLLMQRSEKEGSPRVYAFNTFFFPKLAKNGHAALKRWTRTVDLFSFDILLVPLHFTMHWCLAVVDFRKHHIAYYDSLCSSSEQPSCLATLQQYLEDESQHKRNHGLNWDSWTLKVMDVPRQQNGSDCGMFTCQYAECISRDAPISFGQQHMPYFRKRVVYEILHKAILSA
uniref:Sentrin-specific protease 1 n=1 Tax=Rhipicephalus zambeziensis TaxID=60191 RepID=A0A224Z0T5_9ACAR